MTKMVTFQVKFEGLQCTGMFFVASYDIKVGQQTTISELTLICIK